MLVAPKNDSQLADTSDTALKRTLVVIGISLLQIQKTGKNFAQARVGRFRRLEVRLDSFSSFIRCLDIMKGSDNLNIALGYRTVATLS